MRSNNGWGKRPADPKIPQKEIWEAERLFYGRNTDLLSEVELRDFLWKYRKELLIAASRMNQPIFISYKNPTTWDNCCMNIHHGSPCIRLEGHVGACVYDGDRIS